MRICVRAMWLNRVVSMTDSVGWDEFASCVRVRVVNSCHVTWVDAGRHTSGLDRSISSFSKEVVLSQSDPHSSEILCMYRKSHRNCSPRRYESLDGKPSSIELMKCRSVASARFVRLDGMPTF